MKETGLVIGMVVIIVLGLVVGLSSMDSRDALSKEVDEYNYAIGTQTVGAKYQFTNETMLVETANRIKDMGSNILKFSMHPRYCTENYGLPKQDAITSLTKLATLEPSVKKVLDMDFKYYHIWAYGFSQYTSEPEGQKNDTTQVKFIGGYPKKYQKALYDELFELATHLLTTYNNTGKIFYLGHWEGDWHLRWNYKRHSDLDSATLNGMIVWEKTRQRAIDDARASTPHKNVEIYNYIEVNLVKLAREENHQTVVNAVVPKVNPDYVSYSSYDGTNPYKTEAELNKHLLLSLDYIESQLQPKSGLPEGRRVWIGEYGTHRMGPSEEVQNERSIWVMKTGLEWGTPFILYWEMFNNEIDKESGQQVGYWLIDDKGQKQKVWYTHNEFYNEGRVFVSNYYYENGKIPSQQEFFEAAVNFEALKTKR